VKYVNTKLKCHFETTSFYRYDKKKAPPVEGPIHGRVQITR
jgi:hypothetical protein